MDKLIDPSVRRKRTLRRIGISIAIIACAWAALASSLSWLRPAIKQTTLRTARVERGTIEVGFDASGTVVPASERALSSPIDARLLRVVRRAGSIVRAGDPLLELDTSMSRLALDRLTDRIVQNQSQRQQLESQRDQTLDSLESQLQQSRLDLEILRYRDQQNQRLHAEGLVAEESARESAVAARKAEIELQQLERSIESTRRSSAAQIASVDAELRTLRNEKDQAERQLELAQTRADRDGVLTWVVDQEGTTIRSGEVVARIADLSSWRIEATVSDIHAGELRPGLRVRALLGDDSIEGRIASVDPTIQTGVARFFVELEESSDARLRNSMRIDLFVVTGERENAVKVKKGIFSNGVIFRIDDDVATRVPVRFGMSNREEIEIVSGLEPGDEVILSDMSDYAQTREIRMKEGDGK